MNTAIKAENIKKVYKLYNKPSDRVKEALRLTRKKKHEDHYALNDISFEIKKGEKIGIIGVNGAGKSTLLKIITGLIKPTEGTLQVNGKIAALIELGAGFNPEYTGIENIYFNGMIMGYTKEEMDEKLDAIIEFADIGEFINQPVKIYSSGMFARLAFSVAINVNPDILIVDEALSVGDVFFQKKCYAAIKELMEEKTVLIVSHDLNSISKLCDRSILLAHGEVVYEGDTTTAITEYYKVMHGAKEINTSSGQSELSKVDASLSVGLAKIETSSLSGKMDVEIQGFKYYINNKANIDMISSGDRLMMIFEIKVNRAFEDIIVGYMVEDKYGNVIFGENSITSGIQKIRFDKEICYLEIDIEWPEIKEDDYFITVGIGEGEEVMVQTEQCWAHNIIHLNNTEKGKIIFGLFNQKIEELRIH